MNMVLNFWIVGCIFTKWETICFAFQQHCSHYAGYCLPQMYLSISLLLCQHSNCPHQTRNVSCMFAQVSFLFHFYPSVGACAHKSVFLKSAFNPSNTHTHTYRLPDNNLHSYMFARNEAHSATVLFVITDLQQHFRLFFLILNLDWLEFMLFHDHVPNAELDNDCTNVLWKLQLPDCSLPSRQCYWSVSLVMQFSLWQ